MKRLLLLVFIFLFANSTTVFSQGGPPPPPPLPSQTAVIYFNYENAGNQTRKYYKLEGIVAKKEQEEVAEELTDVDISKEENLSQLVYYPNPIENELILNWSTSINSKVTSIEVYSIDARLLHSHQPKNTGEYHIPFNTYTAGIYIVKAVFDNGKKDTFKVLKK